MLGFEYCRDALPTKDDKRAIHNYVLTYARQRDAENPFCSGQGYYSVAGK